MFSSQKIVNKSTPLTKGHFESTILDRLHVKDENDRHIISYLNKEFEPHIFQKMIEEMGITEK